MDILNSMMYILQNDIIIRYILPFLLVFTLIFAIMQKVKIFGSDPSTKRYNLVVALVIGIIFIVTAQNLVDIMLLAVPQVGIVLVAILMALIIIGLLGKRVELGGNSLSGWIAMVAFAVVTYIFGAAAGWWWLPGWLNFLGDGDLMALIVTILVFAIIIWFVTHEPKDPNADDEKKIGKQFANLLKGPND